MTEEEIERLTIEDLEGTLSVEDRAVWGAFLNEHPKQRRELEDLRRIHGAVRPAHEALDPARLERLTERVMSEVPRGRSHSPKRWGLRTAGMLSAVAGLVLVLILASPTAFLPVGVEELSPLDSNGTLFASLSDEEAGALLAAYAPTEETNLFSEPSVEDLIAVAVLTPEEQEAVLNALERETERIELSHLLAWNRTSGSVIDEERDVDKTVFGAGGVDPLLNEMNLSNDEMMWLYQTLEEKMEGERT